MLTKYVEHTKILKKKNCFQVNILKKFNNEIDLSNKIIKINFWTFYYTIYYNNNYDLLIYYILYNY